MAKVLLLEDDEKLAESISAGLSNDHIVEWVKSGDEALDMLSHYHFDLAVLDWSVLGLAGVDVCKQYRGSGGSIPILMLTGKQDVSNKEEAFGIGADDYLTKPFHFRELAVRVTALLRRPAVIQQKLLTVGNVSLDLDNKTASVEGKILNLKPAECALLELFFKTPTRVFTAAELLAKLYPSDTEATDEAVRQRIFRLRKALDGTNITVTTLPTQGYRLDLR